MKIAVATDDGKTTSRHFGRAPYYLVFTIDDGKIVAQEQREKANHHMSAHEHHEHHAGQHGTDAQSDVKHSQMIETIRDCEAVIVRGMGTGAYVAMKQAQIRPIITDVNDAEAAALAYSAGTLTDHPEWLH